MKTVLPLITRSEDQRLLREWLKTETEYDVVAPHSGSLGDISFDVCITDALGLERHSDELQEKKAQEEPVFLPYLVLTSRQSVQNLDINVWKHADDVIWHTVDEVITSKSISKFELHGRLRSLLGRRETALDLYQSEEECRSLTEDAFGSSNIGTVIVGPDDTVVWFNQQISEYFGISRESSFGIDYEELITEHVEPVIAVPENFADIVRLVASSKEVEASVECQLPSPDGSSCRWVDFWSHPIKSGLHEGGRVEYYVDITARKEYEQTLLKLHQASRDLMQAKTKAEIYDTAVAAANNMLGLSAIGLYVWDDETGTLRPRASTDDIDELYEEKPVFEPGNSLAWDVFLDGETAVFEDVRKHEKVYNPDTEIRGELMVPVGEQGILLSGATTTDAFSERDVRATETLAANTAAALDRATRETALAESEAALQGQNELLTRLNRVNTTIRDIQKRVIEASTRNGVEAAICEKLVQTDPYELVWVSSVDEETGRVTPRTWAGDESGFLDQRLSEDRPSGESEESEQSPIRRAWDTHEPVTVHNLRSKLDAYPWARAALERGYQSVLAIPLHFRGTVYGVVEIYAEQSSAFSDDEREMLQEVCDFVANALNAIERKQALVTESDAELEFRVEEQNDVLFRIARSTECTFDLNSVFPQPNGTWLLYITVTDGDPKAIETVDERFVSVERITPVDDSEDTFELEVTDFHVGTALAEQGATLHALTVKPDCGRVVVHLPQTTDVRSFAEACTGLFADAKLVRQHSITSDIATEEPSHLAVDQLTDRQREVLEVAFRNGFFAWPRESTGEEIAEQLDVSPPTFHRHVRRGTDILLESLFD